MRTFPLLLVVFAAAAAQSAQAQNQPSLAALQAACTQDAQRLCAGVQPGGGRIIACLKQHKDALSDQCKQAAGLPVSQSSPAPSAPGILPPAGASPPVATPGSPSAVGTSPAKPSHSSAGSGTTSPTAASSNSYLRMKQVQVIAQVVDPSLGQGSVSMPAVDLLIPSTWTFKSNIQGNTTEGCFSDIFSVSWEATSADGSLAFQRAPNDSWQYADDPAALKKLNDPSRRALGLGGKPCPVKKPTGAEAYLRQNILAAFPGGSTVISVEPFPELNEIARQQLGLASNNNTSASASQTDAIRARIAFQKDGKDMEDWVTVVLVTSAVRQGQGSFYDCHAIDVLALRAPKGKLDGNEKLFKVMISSIRTEPKWQTYSSGFIARLYQAEAQKESSIDTMWANFQNHVAQTIMATTANAQRGADNSAFAADQNIRGVQTFRDPASGKTMELSNQYDHAWLNGSNEYVMSDDPNFNPNSQLNGDWNQLQTVHPAP